MGIVQWLLDLETETFQSRLKTPPLVFTATVIAGDTSRPYEAHLLIHTQDSFSADACGPVIKMNRFAVYT